MAKSKSAKLLVDKLTLVGWSLLLIVVFGSAFYASEAYGFSPAWVFAPLLSLIFLVSVGWGLRAEFKSRKFVAFFAVWVVLHAVFMLILLALMPFWYLYPFIVIELFVGYGLAYTFFGVLPDNTHPSWGAKREDQNQD